MANKQDDSFDPNPDIPGWIIGLVAFVTTAGFIKLWEGDTSLVTIVLLAIGMGGGLLACVYLAFKRTPVFTEGGKGVWKYPRWRPWALAGLVIIPLLTATGAGYHYYRQTPPSEKTIILVADFDSPDPQKHRVTETILTYLRETLKPDDDVEIIALDEPITQRQGRAVARAKGEQHQAAIVIWGWYRPTSKVVPMRVHFEVLRPSPGVREPHPQMKGWLQVIDVADLDKFSLQPHLSTELTYLSLFTVGLVHYVVGDWDRAIVRFSEALNQTVEPVPVLDQRMIHFKRGVAYASKGDYDRAIADFDMVVKLKPGWAKIYFDRGLTYYLKGDYDRAIADFDLAIKLRPGSGEAYYNRGLAYYNEGNYDRAIADFDLAIKLRPGFGKAYNNRGAAYYYSEGDYDQALADFNQIIHLNPVYAEAYNNRGVAYYTTGDYAQAIVDFDQAIKLNPHFGEAYYNRAVVYSAKGDNNQAVADFNQAIKIEPSFTNSPDNIYDPSIVFEDEIEASFAYLPVPEWRPPPFRLAETYYNRGAVYQIKGETDRAIADFKEALKASNDPDLRRRSEAHLEALVR